MPQPRRLNHAGGPMTLDAALGDVAVMLSGAVTPLTVANLGPRESFRALFIQDAAGGHAVTWPAWSFAGGPPAIDPAPGAVTAVVIAQLAAGPRAWVTDFGSLEIAAAVLLADDPAAVDASTIALINTRLSMAANLSDLADADAALSNLGLSSDTRSLVKAASFAVARTLLGLNNVDNTSDADKPVSTAQSAAVASAIATAALKGNNLSDLADAGVARRNLAIPGRNYVENPSFDVWQAGTSFALTASTNAFLADRWKGRRPNSAGIVVSRQSGFAGARYCLRAQRTVADASTDNILIYHQIESALAVRLAGKTVVLSFDARRGADYSSLIHNLNIKFISGTGDDEPINMNNGQFATGTVSGTLRAATLSTSAARFEIVGEAIPPDASELVIQFSYAPTGTAGAADYFEITNIKLEVGPATPFEASDPADTMAACLRRYRKSFPLAAAPVTNAGAGTGERRVPAPLAGAVTQRLGMVSFGAPMRAVPTVTCYNPAAANAQVRDLTAGADCSATAIANITENGFEVTCTGAASTVAGGDLGIHWTADARL